MQRRGRLAGAARRGMMGAVLGAVLLAIPMVGSAASRDRGVDLFMRNRIDDALPVLVRESRARPDADRHAWLADAYRRLGRRAEADSAARLSLALRPCHAFAHQVLSSNFMPQYGAWSNADPDSAWSHAVSAARCDSADGNVWVNVWVQAIGRGDHEWEERALRGLHATRFFPRAVMAYNRWMLRDLPQNAVLIVNGDVDTYPAHVLQAIEGVRPDVAIVNLSLLETDWYRRRVRDRYGVKMPFTAAELDGLEPVRDVEGEWSFPSRLVVTGWDKMVQSGTLERPLAISMSVPETNIGPDSERRVVRQGAFWLVQRESTAARIDTVRVRASLTALAAADFVGPWVSRQDRSPVRNQATSGLVDNVFASAAHYFEACSDAGNAAEAEAMQKWAARFASEAKVGEESRSMVRDMKRRLSETRRP